MAFERPARAAPAINLSALIDVVFILLIFVILAANFDRLRDLEVELPRAHAEGNAGTADVVVVITAAGEVRLDGVAVEAADLRPRLVALRERAEGLVVRADGAVAFERAVAVLGEASAAGFHKVSIATQAPSGGQP